MSSKTTYKCDRCGKEGQNISDLELKEIVFGIKDRQYGYVYIGNSTTVHDASHRSVEWCVACRKAVGIDPVDRPKTDEPLPPPPSIEDLLRELIREEMSNAG